MSRQMKFWGVLILSFMPAFSLLAEGNLPGELQASAYLEPLENSEAYRQYLLSPKSEYAKLLFLLDRFEDSGFQIDYGGHYYDTSFSSKIARWHLKRMYDGESVQEWILKWCNRTVPSGKLIWVKFPNGKFRLGREVLLEELQALEAALKRMETSPLSLAPQEGAKVTAGVSPSQVTAPPPVTH